MSSSSDRQPSTEPESKPKTGELLLDIAQARAEMSANLGALEHHLDPVELRQKAMVELGHVEARVKEIVQEQLAEARTFLKTELAEAREVVKTDLIIAKDYVKKEVGVAFDNAKKSVRAATIGKAEDAATKAGEAMNDARDMLIDTVRQNPFPAALAGIGVAWLLMNRSRSSRRPRDAMDRDYGRNESGSTNGRSRRGGEITVRGAVHAVGEHAGHLASQIGDTLGGIAHGASEAATSAVQGVTQTVTRLGTQTSESAGALVHQATTTATQLAHQAEDMAGHAADGARDQARRIEHGFQSALEGNPVALGAAALAIGAAFGFALPRTQRENELMGRASGGVIRRAEEAAEGAIHAVQHLSEKAAKQAVDALREVTT